MKNDKNKNDKKSIENNLNSFFVTKFTQNYESLLKRLEQLAIGS